MLDLLADNPLLTLLVVIALGSLAGQVRVAGVSLGVSAVLFVGMAVSALDDRLALPEIVYLLGLTLFVYTIGIEAGSGFLETLRRRGLQVNLLALTVVTVGAVEVVVLGGLLDLDGPTAAGMYTGALTNTPALAGVLESLSGSEAAQPVVGYSLAYPIGVLGIIVPIAILQGRWAIDHTAEAAAAGLGRAIDSVVVRVTRIDHPVVRELGALTGTAVEVSRIESGGRADVARAQDALKAGDVVTLLGDSDELDVAASYLGVTLHQAPSRAQLDYRRMFVSNPNIVGRTLRELALRREHGIVITRIRRGDADVLAHSDSVLQLGDRVRVVAPKERMAYAEELLGDSYREVSEFDILTFAVGLSLGLLLGLVPFPLPGGGHLELGFAGGPLVVALALGAVGRTGPFVWQLPYGVGVTLRELGVVLFLAGIGTRAGGAFADAFSDPDSLLVLAVGALVTLTASLTVLLVGRRVLRLPFGQVMGMTAGVHTQPAALAFADEQAGNQLPDTGYASVYPVAMIAKIALAQIVLVALG
ncbi:MAG: transporter [Solirubrobacterales bacterium]|nr:transporter [Solirubrobacterales bacterium]